MIQSLINLAKDIEKDWEPGSSFSALCFERLSTFQNDLDLNDFENNISTWMLGTDLPQQLNAYDGFGQPPVTVFNNGKFVIDIYFWMNIDTSIHSHAFSGAFKVLYGRSIHEEYLIKEKTQFFSDIMTTDFEQTSAEILKQGDCREILKGNLFNHRLVHLDIPTITLCARTINDKKSRQWHHFSNGLSVEKKDLSQNILKCLYFYNYLFKVDQEKAFKYIGELIKTCDHSSLLNLYEKLSMDSMGLEEDAIEVFTEVFINNFGETRWFKLYTDFFTTLEQNYIELNGDTAEVRFLEHALAFSYSKDKACELLEEIQGHRVSEEQKKLLSNL